MGYVTLLLAMASSFVSRTSCASTATFLRVADDLEGPNPYAVFPNVTIATCGKECFKAGFDTCLGFQWQPYSAEDQGSSGMDTATESPEECSRAPIVGSNSEGRCGLLTCVPDPFSLVVSQGSQMYFFRGKGNLTYGLIGGESPRGYSMACTYAYRIFDKKLLTYEEAERQCQMDRAMLLSIKNAVESSLIEGKILYDDGYWFGLTDRNTEGDYVASDGTIPVYENWDGGQPNNFVNDKGEDQDCVMIYHKKWNDNQCSRRLKFICQIRYIDL